MEVEIKNKIYYNEERMSGIYSAVPIIHHPDILMNEFRGYYTMSLRGNTRQLMKGERYKVRFKGVYTDPKYGHSYEILEVEQEKLNTIEAQDRFLQAIITERQFATLKQAYPNDLIVDLIVQNKVDTSKTKGIKKSGLAKIKKKIEDNAHISVLIAKLNELELTTGAINKLLSHFMSSEQVLKVIEEDIYRLCEVGSFGFSTVDAVALKRGDDPNHPKRIEACLFYLLDTDNNRGHTWSEKNLILKESIALLNLDKDIIIDTLDRLCSNGVLYGAGNILANPHVRNKEIQVLQHLIRIRDNYIPNEKSVEDIESAVDEMEAMQGFKYASAQREAIVDGYKHGVIVINGVAGSGKTLSVKGLIDVVNPPSYMTACLSGKAVNVLSQRGVEASTIHRMLGWTDGQFIHDESDPLPYPLVVVDEMSMVDVSLLLSVLKAVPNGAKLILVGDSGQLPAIGYGDVIRDLLSTQYFPCYELTEVHRQAAKSGILSLANTIRGGNQIGTRNSDGMETYGELEDQTVISYINKDEIPYDIISIATAYKEKIKTPEDLLDFQVIVAMKERGVLSVRNVNIELQKIFNDMNKPFISRNNYNYREGDKIIASGNTYDEEVYEDVKSYLEPKKTIIFNPFEYDDEDENEEDEPHTETIYNGTMGVVHAILEDEKVVLFKFEGIDGLVAIHQTGLDKIDMAYAITVHRVQGSGINNVIFAIDNGSYVMLSKQLVYTALTRAVNKGVMLAESSALFTAISIDASGIRRTFLKGLIEDEANRDNNKIV